MRKSSASRGGPLCGEPAREMMCSKLFTRDAGIDLEYGITTSNIAEAHLNQHMISSAQEVIVLADSSKFGKRGFGKICNLTQIHHIITKEHRKHYPGDQGKT
ncbi:MAG: hypothetical protein R2744_08430 [Bacteroidales bacterium]